MDKGFTLLEIMVALAILGIALGVILQQFSGGLKAIRVSREYTTALIHAREKLEEFSLQKKLSEKAESGEFEDGYRWRVIISPFGEDQGAEDQEFLLLRLCEITSMVSWGEGKEKRVEVATLKVVPKEGWE